MDNVREKAEQINENLRKEIEMDKLSDMIKDNNILFNYKDKSYRIRLLTLGEKEELLKFQAKKEMEMLQEGSFKYERVLIPLLKQAGIDIVVIDKEIEKLNKEEESLMLKLGEAMKKDEAPTTLQIYHDDIKKIQQELRPNLVIEKSLRLANSIESQLLDYTIKYIVYLSLEIKENKEYTRIYSAYSDLLNDMDESLLKKAIAYSTLLQYDAE
jgi:hypothetical protein